MFVVNSGVLFLSSTPPPAQSSTDFLVMILVENPRFPVRAGQYPAGMSQD
jgi:hypothetical protein